MRQQVRALHSGIQHDVLDLAGILVTADDPLARCALCHGSLHVLKTVTRTGLTLSHGSFRVRETVRVCASGCRQNRAPVVHRAAALTALLPPGRTVGYDVMTYVGLARFVSHRQRDEIRAALAKEYGLVLSTGAISDLARRFLMYLKALHRACAPALAAALSADGGWPLHVDATGEDGRGTLLVLYAGWRHWVLGASKVSTERAELILPEIHEVAKAFGTPCAIMRDLGRAMAEATEQFVTSLPQPIPILACHYHFLADIGGDLLAAGHDQLRALFRQVDIVPRLRVFVRQHGDRLGRAITEGRDGLRRWLAEPPQGHRVPEGRSGLTVIRSLAQWVLDYRADATGQGFPFDLPFLALYSRCFQVAWAGRRFLQDPPADRQVAKSLQRLQEILRPVACDVPPFTSVAKRLMRRAELFTELRDALRLESEAVRTAGEIGADLTTLHDIQTRVTTLEDSLRAQRPARGPDKDTRQAIDVVLSHLDRHGRYLWGHAITVHVEGGTRVRLVDRTNDCLEAFFHGMKHGERRRSGRKILTQDFERLPPEAALAVNLTHADYVMIVCGSLERLPMAFAALDAPHRHHSVVARATLPAVRAETASLSAADRRFVRTAAMGQRIMAASESA